MSFGDIEAGRGAPVPVTGVSMKGHSAPTGAPAGGRDAYDRANQMVMGNIHKISTNVAAMSRMVNCLGSNKDTHDLRDRLHNITEQTRDLTKETSDLIKRLSNYDGGSQSVNRQRKMQQQKLVKDFNDVLRNFSEIQKLAQQKERASVARARRSISHSRTKTESDEEKESLLASQKAQLLQFDNEIQFNEALIAEREEGIKEIQNSINEVNEIFKDLALLVNEQGVLIDNIEGHISSAVHKVEDASGELAKANKYQKRSRTKMCCLALIILAVTAVIILVMMM